MQVGIPVAYNVCEVKLDKINHWICVQRGFSSCDGIFAHPITNPIFNLYFNIPSQLEKILSVYTYPMVYFIKFYFTYIVSNWDPNLHFMILFM